LKKKSQPKQSTTKIGKNKGKIEPISSTTRSPTKKKANTGNLKNTMKNQVNSEKAQIDLDFESAMLEMTFDNLAGLMKTLGIPTPQATKIKQQAKLIATFNQKMIHTGHPDQVINLGEKLMPWILKISTAGMFVEPLGKLLIHMAEKKKEDSIIAEEAKSARG
jgi:hypothetical protein